MTVKNDYHEGLLVYVGCLGGTAVRASNFRSNGLGFDLQPGRNKVTKSTHYRVPALLAGVKAGCE